MDGTEVQWIGSNCGRHGSYTFYRGFRITVDDKVKNYCLGEFYFVRNSSDEAICIAELQLVWYDANSDSKLASARLYFCPKDTPFGRQTSHGQDELLYADQKVVIKCADMVSWHCSGAGWNHGLVALNESNFTQKNGSFLLNYASLSKTEDNVVDTYTENEGTSKIIILTFPAYCRYRALLKRLSGSYLTKTQVLALGGVVASDRTTRIMFCRDCFHHPDLDKFELSGETKAPVLKGRPRRKKKLRGVPLTNVLKKKKFLADIQNCLSEGQDGTKRLKTSDEEDTESDRSEASVKSFESISEKPQVQKQGHPQFTKPPVEIKPVKVADILTQNGLVKRQAGTQLADTPSKVPPLISASKAKKAASCVGIVPKQCIPLQANIKQISTSLKIDVKPPPLNSFSKPSNPSKNITIKQEPSMSIKKDKNLDSERLTSLSDSKPKHVEGLVKPNATALAMVKCGVGSLKNSVPLVISDVSTVVKAEVKSDPDNKLLRCPESQGTLSSDQDTKKGKENVKEHAPKKRKRLRQPGDLKDELEEYEDEDEKFFMHSLRDFMKARDTPIGKIPALGFKKVNLWTMYNTTQKLGGYDVVTSKRLWRYVYDSLGGSTTITSAATYSRRHYERLLLPYERFVRNQLQEKKEKNSPGKPGPQGNPPPTSAKQDRTAIAVVSVPSCPPSKTRCVTGSETMTTKPTAVSFKSEMCSISQNRLVVSQALPKGSKTGSEVSATAVRVDTLSKDQLSKVSTRIPTSVQGKMTVQALVGEQLKDVLPMALSRQHHDVPQKAPPREQHEVPRVLSREQYEVPRVPSREQHEVPRVPSREKHEVPRVPSREQHEVPRVPSREQHEVPRVPSREQHEVLRQPFREQRGVTRVPSRDHYSGPQMPSQSQHDVPRSLSREKNNASKVSPKDGCNASRGLQREQHGVPKVATKEQHGVPRAPSNGQQNVPDKSTQARYSASGNLSKEQRRMIIREQSEIHGGPHQGHPNAPKAHAEPLKASVRMGHEAPKRSANTPRDLHVVSGRLSGEQRSVFHASVREQESATPRAPGVSKSNQHDIPRAPSREQHEEPLSRGHRDAAKATHLTQNDAPRLPSRDGLKGPIGGEKAPVMNEQHFPRSRLEVHTSMGVIDLTNDDSASDVFSVYASQASTPPVSSSRGFSRFPRTLTAHDVREAMSSESQRAVQPTISKSDVPDDQSASALHSRHDRKVSSKPKPAALHAEHAHKKAKQRFHPYERRVTHSPSLESADEHFDEWHRRLLAQHPHTIFSGIQSPAERAAFHFFPSPYAYMPREQECPQERRKEGGSAEQKQQQYPEELNSQYADALAFQSCLNSASISEASAFAMRTAHAPTSDEDIASSVEHLCPTSRIFMPSPQLFSPQLQMVPMSPSVLAAGPLIAGSDEQFHIHPHCLMATPYTYPGGSASIPYPLHSFT